MTWKQIEASREIRLWFKEVIVPTAVVGGILASNPEVRESVKAKYNKVKDSVQNKFKKKEEEA